MRVTHPHLFILPSLSVIHLLAMAHAVDVPLCLDDFQ